MSVTPDPTFADFFWYAEEFMFADLARDFARVRRKKESGSNFLVALGLLCGTEAFGRWTPGGRKDERSSRHNFELFFRRLGPAYAALVPAESTDRRRFPDPYVDLRCAFVHAYVPEEDTHGLLVSMLKGEEPCGVHIERLFGPDRQPGGQRYVLSCERYFEDLVVAAADLHRELLGLPHPTIHRWAPLRFDGAPPVDH